MIAMIARRNERGLQKEDQEEGEVQKEGDMYTYCDAIINSRFSNNLILPTLLFKPTARILNFVKMKFLFSNISYNIWSCEVQFLFARQIRSAVVFFLLVSHDRFRITVQFDS